MYYSAIGILAIFILAIENNDIIFNPKDTRLKPVWKTYRLFLFSVLVYYLTDVLWGVIEYYKQPLLLFADTQIFFISLAVGILLWTKYVVTYLDAKNTFGRLLIFAGRLFFAAVTLLVLANFFTPIVFSVDENCVYHASPVRYAIMISQVVLLFAVSLKTFISRARSNRTMGKRYRTIAMFGLIMGVFITIQLWFPLLPLCSVAFMLGTSLLHSFVVNDEKEEYKTRLEEAFEREKHQFRELTSTRMIAYKDALTGVKNKAAYVEMEEKKDAEIRDNKISELAIAVFDLNYLKNINDRYGHEKGDRYIVDACGIICKHFKHSPVFRIGGDEFVAILEKDEYKNRHELKRTFNDMMNSPANDSQPIIALGMSDFSKGSDSCLNDVFIRADKQMYKRKREIKKNNP